MTEQHREAHTSERIGPMTTKTWITLALGIALVAIPITAFAAAPAPVNSPASDFDTHVVWMEANWDAMSAAMESGNMDAMHALMQSAPGMDMGSMTGEMGSMMGSGEGAMTGGDHDHASHSDGSGMGGMDW